MKLLYTGALSRISGTARQATKTRRRCEQFETFASPMPPAGERTKA